MCLNKVINWEMDLKNIEKFPNKDRLVSKCLNRGWECVSFE